MVRHLPRPSWPATQRRSERLAAGLFVKADALSFAGFAQQRIAPRDFGEALQRRGLVELFQNEQIAAVTDAAAAGEDAPCSPAAGAG